MADQSKFKGFMGVFVNASQTKNPFQDNITFESFVPFEYSPTKQALEHADMDKPLNVYKYMLLKLCEDDSNDMFKQLQQRTPHGSKKNLANIQKVIAKYREFLNKAITVTSEEKKYLKSAYNAVQLAEIVYKMQSLQSQLDYDFDKFDFQKFKEVCGAILQGHVGEIVIQYFITLFESLAISRWYEVSRFILCLIIEIIQKTEKVRNDNGVIGEVVKLLQDHAKMKATYYQVAGLFTVVFPTSDVTQTFNSLVGFNIPSKDSENGAMLMELLGDCNKDKTEFHTVQLKAENYGQAKQIYDLMMQLIGKLKVQTVGRGDRYVKECIYFESLAHGHFAGFQSNPAETYRLCEKSAKLLEKISDTSDANAVTKCYQLGLTDLNYRRMWKIKYEIYKKDKNLADLNALKEVAEKRTAIGKSTIASGHIIPYSFWWIHLDLVQCYLKVFQDITSARNHAAKIYNELKDDPLNILVFCNQTELDDSSFSSNEAFCMNLIRKLK